MTPDPHFGRTRHGLPVHLRAADHLPVHSAYAGSTGRSRWAYGLRRVDDMRVDFLPAGAAEPAGRAPQAFGLRVFPHWLVAVGLIALVAWIAQTFLQLVLFPVIMVGQNVQQAASDARAAKTV